jgi:hypothetical protein
MNNSIGTIGIRTRDIPACSAVPPNTSKNQATYFNATYKNPTKHIPETDILDRKHTYVQLNPEIMSLVKKNNHATACYASLVF